MKKVISNSLMSIAALCIVSYGTFFVKSARASTEPNIHDPLLLEAWTRLDQHQAPIQLWDGSTLTGHALAQYLLEHAIPLVWDTERVCGGGSCSVLYCTPDTYICTYEDGKPGVDPIYLVPAEDIDMQSLVGTLAHETFHRTQPFGAVPDTRFEEYWAFWIGAHISQSSTPRFDGYDSLISGHLYLWLLKNGMDAYYALPEFPVRVVPLVQSHS